jgi:hypothetical protein
VADQRPPDDDFGQTWLLLRPLESPRGIKASLRFRAALKVLLRQFHLRCERVTCEGPDGVMVELPPEDAADANVAKPETL